MKAAPMRDPEHISPQTDKHTDAIPSPPGDQRPGLTISISPRTIAIVVGIWLASWVMRELTSSVLLFAGAILLATAIDMPATQLEKRGMPRWLSIISLFAIILGVLITVIAVLVPLVTDEVSSLQEDLTTYETQIQDFLNKHGARVHLANRLDVAQISSRVSDNIGEVATQLTSITLEISHAAVLIFAMLVIAFMLAMNPSAGAHFTSRFMTEPAHDRLLKISGDIHRRIGGWVRGQIIVAVTFGVAFGIGLKVLGIPYAISLGLTASALEIVPYLGGAVTLVLAVGIALSISLPHAFGVLLLYIVLINIESHILAPKFIGEAVGLPSVVVLGALLVGLEWKGILGVLLAVPAVLVVAAIIDEFWPSPEQERQAAAKADRSLFSRLRHFFLSLRRTS